MIILGKHANMRYHFYYKIGANMFYQVKSQCLKFAYQKCPLKWPVLAWQHCQNAGSARNNFFLFLSIIFLEQMVLQIFLHFFILRKFFILSIKIYEFLVPLSFEKMPKLSVFQILFLFSFLEVHWRTRSVGHSSKISGGL